VWLAHDLVVRTTTLCDAHEVVEKATRRSVREAIQSAKRGESSMLEASTEMPLAKAQWFTTIALMEDAEAHERVTTFSQGPWLHIVPRDPPLGVA
jgi:hypothetical protein